MLVHAPGADQPKRRAAQRQHVVEGAVLLDAHAQRRRGVLRVLENDVVFGVLLSVRPSAEAHQRLRAGKGDATDDLDQVDRRVIQINFPAGIDAEKIDPVRFFLEEGVEAEDLAELVDGAEGGVAGAAVPAGLDVLLEFGAIEAGQVVGVVPVLEGAEDVVDLGGGEVPVGEQAAEEVGVTGGEQAVDVEPGVLALDADFVGFPLLEFHEEEWVIPLDGGMLGDGEAGFGELAGAEVLGANDLHVDIEPHQFDEAEGEEGDEGDDPEDHEEGGAAAGVGRCHRA